MASKKRKSNRVSATTRRKTVAKASKKGKAPASIRAKPAKDKAKKSIARAPVAIRSPAMPAQEILDGVGIALQDALFIDYVAKNVGSQANDVLRELSKGPRKDDQLAETVNIKLNEVRRVLNLLNKHGIVRYDVKRDSSGWLTFEWHIDYNAFSDFYKTLSQKTNTPQSVLPENCNDFFVCGSCRKREGVGIPFSFDVAYEKSFKCDCGKNLDALTRSEAENYVRN